MAKRHKMINKDNSNQSGNKGRHNIDYQIISYMPSSRKGERLNIGVVVYDFTTQEVKVNIIDKDSPKLIILNKFEKEVYQNIVQHLLDLLVGCIKDNNFDYLLSRLPDQVIMDNTYSARSDNNDKLLKQLFEVYCDSRFWNNDNTIKFIISPA